MSRDLLDGWGEPRLGLSHDPCWADYWRWTWDRLPLSFPSCTVEVHTRPSGHRGLSVTLHLDRELPMVCRVDDEEGRILAELAPEPLTPGRTESISLSLELANDELPSVVGIGFEWVFFVPVRRFQPTKPLGIVQSPTGPLAGRRLDVRVHRTPTQEPDAAVR